MRRGRFSTRTGGDRLAFAWALLLTRGLRRGELCGLKWSAVDPVAGTLRIESTLITVEGQPVASRPKTQAGLRSISLDAQLVALLRAHRKRQRTEQVAAGPAYEHGGYVEMRCRPAWHECLIVVLKTELARPPPGSNLAPSVSRESESIEFYGDLSFSDEVRPGTVVAAKDLLCVPCMLTSSGHRRSIDSGMGAERTFAPTMT